MLKGRLVRAVASAIAVATFGWISTPAVAQEACPAGPGIPWVGEYGITETVAQIMERQIHTPPRKFFVESDADFTHHRDPSLIKPNPLAPAVPMWPWNFNGHNPPPVSERTWNPLGGGGSTDNPQTISTNVQGVAFTETPGFVPPDSQGCVGPTQIVVIVNGFIRTLNKTTGLADGALNATTDVFFNSVRNGSSTSDPQVRFDRLSNRWFLVIINVSTPNRIMVAVSSGPTIVNSASFTFFFFSQDTPVPSQPGLADYPSLGIDPNALYVGTNRFNPSFNGADAFVIRKSSVTSGGPIVVTVFRNISTGAVDGPYAPRGVDNPDPAATTGYFIGVGTTTFSTLHLRRISTPGATPTISANMVLTVPATVFPRTVAALGTTGALDALDDRLFAAQIRRNRATGVDSIWTAHNIEVNTAGVATTGGGRNGSRWYQINNFTTTPSLAQSGTLFDSTASAISHWIPSVAATGQGHMALGCSAASTTLQPGARTAGRLSTDTPGTIQAPTVIVAGANYNLQGSGTQRWGDYSAVTIDPNDDQTMWTFQEYCNANNSWAVRATKLLAPPPCTPTGCSPSSLAQGATAVNVTVSGSSVSGSAYYDTDATYANRLAAVVGGTGVTVNSITFNPATPTQFTMNVTVSGAAATGARTVAATNPDGQTATSASGILTITGGAICPSFSQNPSPATACDGVGSVTFTVAASGTPAPTFQWRKNLVNIPGATSTSLTFNPPTQLDAGSYDCVASNGCASGPVASTAATLTVNTGPSFSSSPASQTVPDGDPVTFSVVVAGIPAPTLQWRKNLVNIPGETGTSYTIASVVLADAGSYDCVATNSCGSVASTPGILTVSCYANCDGSTVSPILNANDFNCFLNLFANGDPSANCDGSTVSPILNANDFNCFLNLFANGCP